MAQRRKRRTKAQIEADKAAEAAAKAKAEATVKEPVAEPVPEESWPVDPIVAISEEVANEELAASVELATGEPAQRSQQVKIAASNAEARTLSECPEVPCLSRARWKRGRKKGRW